MKHQDLIKLSTILGTLLFSNTIFAQQFDSTSARAIGFTSSQFIDVTSTLSGYGGSIDNDFNGSINDSFASIIGTKQIGGFNTNNEQSTMTFSYEARSQTSVGGVMKTYASGSIENGFYYPLGNDPFVIDTNFNTDPNGVPERFSVWAGANYIDLISLTGASDLSHIQVMFQLDGNFVGKGSTFLGQGFTEDRFHFSPSKTYLEYFFSVEQPAVDTVIKSNLISVDNNQALLNFYLESNVQLYPWNVSDQATSDFYNTLSISGISGFDINGNPVDLISATDSTGFNFNTTRISAMTSPVPEPETLPMMAAGLGMLGIIAKRRKKKTA